MTKWYNRPMGFWSGLFQWGAARPLAALAVVLLLQTVFLLDSRQLWYSDEVRYANVFEQLWNHGKWLVLHLNGQPYPDKPPVYFWLLAGLRALVGSTKPALFFLGSAVSGFAFVLASYALARKVLGADRSTGLATGLVLLSVLYFVGICHYTRMDLLFGAFITLAHVCLFTAWSRERSLGWTCAGFGLAGLATLTKGPLGLAFPLLAGLAWLAWRGRLRRFFRRDTGLGALLCLGLLLAWVAGAWLTEPPDFLYNIFHDQIYKRATDTWHHGQPFWHYAVTLPLAFLPWTFLLVVLPFGRLAKKDFWSGLWAGRKERDPGLSYVWVMALSGFLLLSAVSIKIVIYLLPLFAPLAALAARTVLGLEPGRSHRFFGLAGILLALLGVGQVAGAVVLASGLAPAPWNEPAWGLAPSGLGALLAGHVLFRNVDRSVPGAGLAALVLGVTVLLQPLGLLALPSLDRFMSPAAQARLMGSYADRGWLPMSYRVYSGTYTYYAGRDIVETKSLEEVAREFEARQGKVAVGMRRKDWDQWEDRPAGLDVVHEQWIVERPYVLAVGNATLGP